MTEIPVAEKPPGSGTKNPTTLIFCRGPGMLHRLIRENP
jgi:hypothetical protein